MKKYAIIFIFLTSACFAQIDIRITEVPYVAPAPILTRLSFEMGGKQPCEVDSVSTVRNARSQFGISFGSISTKDSDIQAEMRIAYRLTDLSNLKISGISKHQDFNILLGGRYFPRYPTFGLSNKTPVRITLAALGGLNMRGQGFADQMAIDVILNAGFVISQNDNPSGIMLEFQYRPLGSNAFGIPLLLPSYIFALSWLFGPN